MPDHQVIITVVTDDYASFCQLDEELRCVVDSRWFHWDLSLP
jgi:hypothetical protein